MEKKGVLTNASQDKLQYNIICGLEEYAEEMVDYIVSISINQFLLNRIEKEKAVHNELMIHSSHHY